MNNKINEKLMVEITEKLSLKLFKLNKKLNKSLLRIEDLNIKKFPDKTILSVKFTNLDNMEDNLVTTFECQAITY